MKLVNAIIISISSDIGMALAKKWRSNGWNVFGTYRNYSSSVKELEKEYAVKCLSCDLTKVQEVEAACSRLAQAASQWDILVLASGNLEPVGDFQDVDFEAWEEGIQINLLRQLRIVHRLLPYRNRESFFVEPSVLFFAGGGVNNAVSHYSSYTLSKIALTKMCEFLDAEISDTRFVIIGPGVVKTKIHEPTFKAGPKRAGENYQRLLERLEKNECTCMEDVVECCTWAATTPSKGVRGRNFSVVSDKWRSPTLEKELEKDLNMYKLRRHKNSWVPHETN